MVKEKIDLVVSGINPHENIGHDVTYSGTVTAAMEAVIGGVPGMAVSLQCAGGFPRCAGLQHGGAGGAAGGGKVLAKGLPEGVLLNVNVPYLKWK